MPQAERRGRGIATGLKCRGLPAGGRAVRTPLSSRQPHVAGLESVNLHEWQDFGRRGERRPATLPVDRLQTTRLVRKDCYRGP